MDESQLLRGILEGCVLRIIAEGETYGYEILGKLGDAGFENMLEGTLYPVLMRLEKKGLISCRRAKSPYGPIRKYYSITNDGEQYYKEFERGYRRITKAAENILKEERENG